MWLWLQLVASNVDVMDQTIGNLNQLRLEGRRVQGKQWGRKGKGLEPRKQSAGGDGRLSHGAVHCLHSSTSTWKVPSKILQGTADRPTSFSGPAPSQLDPHPLTTNCEQPNAAANFLPRKLEHAELGSPMMPMSALGLLSPLL